MAKTVLTICGHDPIGGAGLSADIKTITAHKCHPLSILTTIVPQNTLRVVGGFPLGPDTIQQQFQAVFEDIVPNVIKTGAIGDVTTIAEILKWKENIPLVVDPVIVTTTGTQIVSDDVIEILTQKLIPACTIVTPNIDEAAFILKTQITTKTEALSAAYQLLELGSQYVLMKGGHLDTNVVCDILVGNGVEVIFEHDRIDVEVHGSGCTLSAAISCNLALGLNVKDSVEAAINFITEAIKRSRINKVGQGYNSILQSNLL